MYVRIRTTYYIIIISNNSRCMCECTCVCVYLPVCLNSWMVSGSVAVSVCLFDLVCPSARVYLSVTLPCFCAPSELLWVSDVSVSAVSPTAPRDGRYANSGSGAVNKFSGSVGKLLKLVYHKDHPKQRFPHTQTQYAWMSNTEVRSKAKLHRIFARASTKQANENLIGSTSYSRVEYCQNK